MQSMQLAETPTKFDRTGIMEEIANFLASTSMQMPDDGLAEGTDILNSGAIDSLGILQLMMFLGERFEIEIEDDDFVPENFETVGKLVQFVELKQA